MTVGFSKDTRSLAALQSSSARQSPLAASPGTASERRRAGRRSSDLPGYINWDNRLDRLIPCRVRDMSASGALLRLSVQKRGFTMDMLADRFTLVVLQVREETHIDCQLMRRLGSSTDVGVRFIGQFRTLKRTKLSEKLAGSTI